MTRDRPEERTWGFTIPELIVALTIFAVGVLGSAGLVAAAARTLARAEAMAWAVTAAGELADSLALGPVVGDGERPLANGFAAWTVARERRTLRLRVIVRFDTPGRRDSVATALVVADSIPSLGDSIAAGGGSAWSSSW